MNLDRLLQEFPKKYNQLPRKTMPDGDSFIVYGAPGVGKTVALHRFLWEKSKNGKGIYIDFNDLRFSGLTIDELVKFAIEKNITHIAIDNAPKDIAPIDNIAIASASRAPIDGCKLDSFILEPLDFEEFTAFEKHELKLDDDNGLSSVFTRFANIGALPEKLNWPEARRVEFTQRHIKEICQSYGEIEIFKALCVHQSHFVSLLQLYAYLKQKTKISKDSLYENVKTMQDMRLIYQIGKINSPKAPKKIYFADFVAPTALTLNRDFGRLFENAVFCELASKEAYAADNLSFYIPSEYLGVITRPFDDVKTLEIRLKKTVSKIKSLGVKKLDVVTMHASAKYNFEGVEIEIEPFWNWALKK